MHQKSNHKNPVEKRVIAFGEVLWDHLPSGKILGGAPFNFAFRMRSLGHDARLVSCVGRDQLGEEVLQQMTRLKMDLSLIQRDDFRSTGVVQVTLDDGQPDFHIVEDVAYDHIALSDALLQETLNTGYIYWGTLIQRSDESRNTLRQLIENSTGELIFLDLNLRKSCFSYETVDYSLNHSTILKLNDTEVDVISKLLNIPNISIPNFCQQIMSRYHLDVCLVTMGERGAFCMSEQTSVYCPGYQIVVADTIGAGDAFSAGFLHQWLETRDLKSACAFGNALGALVAMQQGATQPVAKTDIQDMLTSGRERIVDPTLNAYMQM